MHFVEHRYLSNQEDNLAFWTALGDIFASVQVMEEVLLRVEAIAGVCSVLLLLMLCIVFGTIAGCCLHRYDSSFHH